MNIVIACEFSGVVRDAFQARGHNAVSVDILPCLSSQGVHFQGTIQDFFSIFSPRAWDMMIAHPPCTYLAASGLFRNNNNPDRQQKTLEALKFVEYLMNLPIEKICIENPIGCISSKIRKPNQIIQPYEYGHPESKKTCLWLKGLPELQPTNILPIPNCGYWDNQTPSKQNKLTPSPDRWKIRSITYKNIADAMAKQWG